MYETTMTMVGRLVDRPKRFDLEGSVLKATFRLAHTARRFDKERGEWVDSHSLYLTVNTWRLMAERVMGTFTKGDPVIVQGNLRTREWEKDGKRHSVTEMEATAVGPDLTWCNASVLRHGPSEWRAEAKEPPAEPPAVDPWEVDEEIGREIDEEAEAGVGV